jgi:ferredoxin
MRFSARASRWGKRRTELSNFLAEANMKIVQIEEDDCIGCETCVELCPDIFAFNNTTSKAYVTTPKGGDQACIDEAIGSCPVSCITNNDE